MSRLSKKRQTSPITHLTPDFLHGRIAIVGVGNDLWGDDGVGLKIVEHLTDCLPASESLLILKAGAVPESFGGVLRRFKPDVVIFCDAARWEEPDTDVRLLFSDEITGISFSTHSLPLNVLGSYLESELHCQIVYLVVRPTQMNFTADLSPQAKKIAKKLAKELATAISTGGMQ